MGQELSTHREDMLTHARNVEALKHANNNYSNHRKCIRTAIADGNKFRSSGQDFCNECQRVFSMENGIEKKNRLEELQNTAKDLTNMHRLLQNKLSKDSKKDKAYKKLFLHLKRMTDFANVIKKQYNE